MSGELDYIAEGLSERLKLRRRMLAHLGLQIDETVAGRLEQDVRETIMACGQCPQPEICRGWMDGDNRGMPMFCRARSAFLRIRAANRDHAPAG